jgi:N-formylmaleamate deformylase
MRFYEGRQAPPSRGQTHMTHWTEHDILANGIRLHYYRTTSPGEAAAKRGAVILCHGFSDDALCWSAVARELEADYDVVMVDARYHGQSEAPRAGDDPDAMSTDLVALSEALGLDHPVAVGHSMGAAYVFRTAVLYPQALRAIVLEDPVWFEVEGARPTRDFSAELRRFAEATEEELAAEMKRYHPAMSDEAARLVGHGHKHLDPRVLERKMAWSPWREALAGLKLPILLYTGEADRGGLVTTKAAAEALRLAPQIEHVPVPGVGHLIRYEAHAAFMAPLKQFLARVYG